VNQIPSAVQVDEEAALAARAAWLHFAGGKTQGEVAELLGVQSTKAHRLIARARAEGLIRVFVEGPDCRLHRTGRTPQGHAWPQPLRSGAQHR
jgi:DNA-binding transcriptional regulator LsrR (DeoR family)